MDTPSKPPAPPAPILPVAPLPPKPVSPINELLASRQPPVAHESGQPAPIAPGLTVGPKPTPPVPPNHPAYVPPEEPKGLSPIVSQAPNPLLAKAAPTAGHLPAKVPAASVSAPPKTADLAAEERKTKVANLAHKLTVMPTHNSLHMQLEFKGQCSCGWQTHAATVPAVQAIHTQHVNIRTA